MEVFQRNIGKHNTSNANKLKASIQRRRNIPRLLAGSKITCSSSKAPDSGPPRIPKTTLYTKLTSDLVHKIKDTEKNESHCFFKLGPTHLAFR